MKALKRRLLSMVTVTGMVAGVLALAAPAYAGTYTVTNINKDAAVTGSLGWAIN